MNSDAPIDKIAEMYAAYGNADAEPFFDLMANDGVMRFAAPEGSFEFAGVHRGPDGARKAIAAINDQFEWLSYSNLELIGEDDQIIAVNGGRIRHRETGRETVAHLADYIRMEDGRIAEFVEFFDTAGILDWCCGKGLPASSRMNPANVCLHGPAHSAARNKTALLAGYEGYTRGDAGPFLSLLSEDATYNSVAKLDDFHFAGPLRGKQAFEQNLSRIAADFSVERYDVKVMIAKDDLVAVHADTVFRNRHHDGAMVTEKIDLFRMYDGKITEFNEFFDTLSAR